MTYSEDLRWRAVILFNFSLMDLEEVAALLDISIGSLRKWTGSDFFFFDVQCAQTIIWARIDH